MALQQAQLAQLPSMNLARYVPSHTYIEPAWHKALSAFMSGAASSAAEGATRNAMSRDVTPDAVKAGVASSSSKSPSYLDQILHGPDWTQSRLQEAEKLQSTDNQRSISNAHMAAQLGLSQEQLDSLNASRKDQLEQRKLDQGNRDADRADRSVETARQHDLQDREHKDSLAARQAAETERRRIDDATIAHTTAETALTQAQTDPNFAGKKQAAALAAMMQMFGVQPGSIGGVPVKPGSAATQSPVQPSNNSDSVNLASLIGGAGAPPPTNAQSVSPSPNQVMQPVGGAPDPLSAREAQNAGTTATQPAQSGQSTPTPPQNPYLKSFLDGAATPGPYNISPPKGTSGGQPSTQFDPDMLRRAALFAQMMSAQGGIPGQGGMPNV